MNLRFFECLCPSNEKILKKCIDLKKYGQIHDYYTSNGFIKVVISEDEAPIKITHTRMLEDLFKDFFMAETLYPV